MTATGIEWTDETWNPVTGCRKVSPGCANCYAETFAKRGMGPWKGRRFEDVRAHADRLDAPLHWRKPRRVFVNSMSDLFHEDVPDDFIDRVFAAMALAEQHVFQVLTKRPERMREYITMNAPAILGGWSRPEKVNMRAHDLDPELAFEVAPFAWPLPNVWLGVSCEDQHRADERVPILLYTPAAVRFVSAEPLLGPINFDPLWLRPSPSTAFLDGRVRVGDYMAIGCVGLDWIIVGGESGPRARPCDVAWVRDIVRQCREAGVACFVKQLGARAIDEDGDMHGRYTAGGVRHDFPKLANRKGADPDEWPADMRVREFPS